MSYLETALKLIKSPPDQEEGKCDQGVMNTSRLSVEGREYELNELDEISPLDSNRRSSLRERYQQRHSAPGPNHNARWAIAAGERRSCSIRAHCQAPAKSSRPAVLNRCRTSFVFSRRPASTAGSAAPGRSPSSKSALTRAASCVDPSSSG